MSSSDFREPTNDQLWSQPPASSPAAAGHPVPAGNQASQTPARHHGSAFQGPAPVSQQPRPDRTVFVLAIVSLGIGVPLTAISSSTAGLPGLLVVWIGIVLVNLVYARSRRRQD